MSFEDEALLQGWQANRDLSPELRLKAAVQRFEELMGQFMAPPFETVQERVAEIMRAA